MKPNKYLIVEALGTTDEHAVVSIIAEEFTALNGGAMIMFRTNNKFDALHHLSPGQTLVATEYTERKMP